MMMKVDVDMNYNDDHLTMFSTLLIVNVLIFVKNWKNVILLTNAMIFLQMYKHLVIPFASIK